MTRLLWLLVGLFVLAWPAPCEAHTRSVSYSTWRVDGRNATVVARVSLLDASLLERAGFTRKSGRLAAHVRDSLRLVDGAVACEPSEPRERVSEPEWVDVEWSLSCPATGALSLESTLLFGQNPSHLHMARVTAGNEPATEHVLDERTVRVALSAGARPSAGFTRFVLLGVEHIATGWDHLLFVLMLLFAAKSLRRTAWVVTGFTLGHSVTLTLTTLGALVPHEGPVEALIALSIALLAVENVWLVEERRRALLPVAAVGAVAAAALAALGLARPSALPLLGVALFAACYFALIGKGERPEVGRAAVAALFGLIHGFGFARVLTSMDLEPARLAPSLVGFNVGVELGQLVAIGLCWPLLSLLRRRFENPALVRVAASGALCLACYWFVGRAFAG